MHTHEVLERVYDLLQAVKDPEIPTVSLVDLGVITHVQLSAPKGVRVEMVPTFAGCPAIQLMKLETEAVLKQAGYDPVDVWVDHNRAWSSNHITPRGRQALLDFGLSPPPAYSGDLELDVLEHALCPKCGSTNTVLQNAFGPTLCRAVHHCNNCHETFQQFKPV
jgi:ring-1,2-phenylacetyl-CoA epoxidase subunit PaaD